MHFIILYYLLHIMSITFFQLLVFNCLLENFLNELFFFSREKLQGCVISVFSHESGCLFNPQICAIVSCVWNSRLTTHSPEHYTLSQWILHVGRTAAGHWQSGSQPLLGNWLFSVDKLIELFWYIKSNPWISIGVPLATITLMTHGRPVLPGNRTQRWIMSLKENRQEAEPWTLVSVLPHLPHSPLCSKSVNGFLVGTVITKEMG